MEPTRSSALSSNFVLLFQIIVNQKEPDHPSFYINIRSKGTFSSKKEPIGKVWYIADHDARVHDARIYVACIYDPQSLTLVHLCMMYLKC